jgi:hypothetical protein
LLLDAREHLLILFQLRHAVLETVLVGHAVGELDEALLKHALTMVALDDGGIVSHAVERTRNRVGGNARGLRVLLEARQPLLEGASVAAGVVRRRGRCRHGGNQRQRTGPPPSFPYHVASLP